MEAIDSLSLRLCFFVILGIFFELIGGSTLHWIPDHVQYQASFLPSTQHYHVNTTANGPILEEEKGGNFKLTFHVQQLQVKMSGSSPCLSAASTTLEIIAALKATNLSYESERQFLNSTNLGSLFYINLIKDKWQHVGQGVFLDFSFSPEAPNVTLSTVTFSQQGCLRTRTYGYWSDKSRWKENSVPVSGDSVVFPANSGRVIVQTNLTVGNLTMQGGELYLMDSSCPSSWTVDDRFINTQKCYKKYDIPLTQPEADAFCNYQVNELETSGLGSSIDQHLVFIGDGVESDLIYRLCRGRNTLAEEAGCWIGLQDSLGVGIFNWIDPRGLGPALQPSIFYDWLKGQPDNFTISEGQPNKGGERCVAIMPWTDNPLLEEQGGWNDFGCGLRKSFICQRFTRNLAYVLTVTKNAAFSADSKISGGQVILNGFSSITSLSVESARLVFTRTSSVLVSQSIVLVDNAKLDFQSKITILGGSFIGEPIDQGALPIVTFTSTSSATLGGCNFVNGRPTPCGTMKEIVVGAKVVSQGNMTILAATTVSFLNGGDLARSALTYQATDSVLEIGGSASRLSSYDAFELSLSHISPVIGIVWPWKTPEPQNTQKGIYKIAVSDSRGNQQITHCLPYNTSIEDMTNALDALPLVQSYGGVTVRRYGNQSELLYRYGYHYHIEFDAVSTAKFANGHLSAAIHCYGPQCGDCYATEVTHPIGYSDWCLHNANFSLINPDSCVIPPVLGIRQISQLSYFSVAGSHGQLTLVNSRHRLPPILPVGQLSILNDGIGVVAADVIDWHAYRGADNSMLVVTGTSWESWESSYLLYAPAWTLLRGYAEELLSVPTATMTLYHLAVGDNSSFLTSSPDSSFLVTSCEWNGGVMGGLGTMTITESFDLHDESNKYLSFGMQVIVAATAAANWTSGDLYLGNGANISVLGYWYISNSQQGSANPQPITIYQAPMFSFDVEYSNPFEGTGGRSWGNYFSARLLDPEIQPGWYLNPLCGDLCLTFSQMSFEGSGILETLIATNISFHLPLNMIDDSAMNVGNAGQVSLNNGGILGNDVVVDLSPGAVIKLTGGSLNMEAKCTITGAGDLLIDAGSHNSAFSINAHITISNGALIWPNSRGRGETLTFYGGLLIEGTGSLQVEPYATKIIVHKEVHLKDQSLIQFPLIGIAAQPSSFDRLDAPNTFPRGNFTSLKNFLFEGGSLTGNADFFALNQLILDGETKNISSVASLINRGHCEWGSGSVVTSNNGNFQNYGTIQVVGGGTVFTESMMYIGTDVPLENGGDPFAQKYHSWDMDNGALDYSQYLQLRTKFVSHVPDGWTPDDQKRR